MPTYGEVLRINEAMRQHVDPQAGLRRITNGGELSQFLTETAQHFGPREVLGHTLCVFAAPVTRLDLSHIALHQAPQPGVLLRAVIGRRLHFVELFREAGDEVYVADFNGFRCQVCFYDGWYLIQPVDQGCLGDRILHTIWSPPGGVNY